MSSVQDRWVRVGQASTRYWAEGESGSNVLFIHGLGGFMENWSPCFGPVSEGHRAYAVDLLGFGRTDKPRDASYGVTDEAAFVKEFMAAVGIDQASIVGHSLGGAVALQLAIQFPEVVEKLVLVNSAGLGRGAGVAWRIMSLPLLGPMLTRPSKQSTPRTLKMFVHDPAFVTAHDVDIHYEMWAQPGAHEILMKAMRAAASLFGQREAMYGPIVRGLPSVTVPVLIVWGRHDQLVPVAHAQIAADRLPNARVHIFENCGHDTMAEQTQAFNTLLRGFLAE